VVPLAIAVRDLVSPGTPLPLPNDDKLQLLVGWTMVKNKRVLAPVPGEMNFMMSFGGIASIGYCAVKLVTVFTALEGTYLRRNLFLLFGVIELLYFVNVLDKEAYTKAQTGTSIMPFLFIYALNAIVYLSDALLRVRKEKKK